MKKCTFCGRMNEDDAAFCSGCGREFDTGNVETYNPIANAMLHYDDSVNVDKHSKICCPRCRSDRLQATVETSTSVRTTGKNYSLGKGLLGRLLFGTPGFLLGSIGQKQRTYIDTQNRNYWICSDCGNKFRNIEDWHEEIHHKEQAVKVNLVLAIIFAVVAVMLLTSDEVFTIIGFFFLIIGAVNAVVFFFSKARIQKELQELEKLEKASTE